MFVTLLCYSYYHVAMFAQLCGLLAKLPAVVVVSVRFVLAKNYHIVLYKTVK